MRLRSLDVFRGLTMAGMVIVNNPGDWATVYAPLLHAEWHGWTPTDLIFPWFLFIMGAALAQAEPARSSPAARCCGAAPCSWAWACSWRASRTSTRRAGASLACCSAWASATWRRRSRGAALAVPGDTAGPRCARCAVAAAVCLLVYWALLALVPPPGGVAGDLTAEGNLGAWLDRAVFGTHLWKARWDPEGLLSSLPAVGTTLMGVMAGLWLRASRPARAAPALVCAGAAATLAGLLWGTVLPINKALWTSSYALFTGGTAALALGLLHLRARRRPRVAVAHRASPSRSWRWAATRCCSSCSRGSSPSR